MALSKHTKERLTQILNLIQVDAPACAALHDSAKRHLGPDNAVKKILGMNAAGVPLADGQAELDAMLAEIAGS